MFYSIALGIGVSMNLSTRGEFPWREVNIGGFPTDPNRKPSPQKTEKYHLAWCQNEVFLIMSRQTLVDHLVSKKRVAKNTVKMLQKKPTFCLFCKKKCCKKEQHFVFEFGPPALPQAPPPSIGFTVQGLHASTPNFLPRKNGDGVCFQKQKNGIWVEKRKKQFHLNNHSEKHKHKETCRLRLANSLEAGSAWNVAGCLSCNQHERLWRIQRAKKKRKSSESDSLQSPRPISMKIKINRNPRYKQLWRDLNFCQNLAPPPCDKTMFLKQWAQILGEERNSPPPPKVDHPLGSLGWLGGGGR